MARQLPLDLGRRPALGRAAFMVSDANVTALAAIDASANWPGGKLALVGPQGSGKTHLVHVWAQDTGAVVTSGTGTDMPLDAPALVIEDIDQIAGDKAREERVFHLHNAVLNAGGRLLVTGRSAPRHWPLVLRDLESRLRAAGVAQLEAPDEALLAAVLVKLFADRQIRAAAAEAAVARLDAEGLARGVPVGRALAAELFGGSATVS